MSDGAANGPEIGIESQEATARGIALYKSNKFDIFVPSKPNIPLNEGLHVEVSSQHDQLDSLREVLSRYAMALGSAKALAESGMTQDAWANTRLEEGQTVSAYGRVPQVEGSWRTPVNTVQRGVETTASLEPYYNTAKLQELFGRYLPKWEQLTDNISLFKNGVNGKDVEPSLSAKEEIPVWENDKFSLVVISNPHLKGTHLVVHPKESFRRQWQTINGSDQEQVHIQSILEATAIAMGVQKLLAEGKGEIHNSGNWAGDLKSTQEGGKLDLEKLSENPKAEKKSHRPDIAVLENQINTGMHAHVYIPSEGPVVLPPMSKQEAIEKGRLDIVKQWEQIPQLNPAQLEEIKVKLGGGKLTNWLSENCKGQLKGQATT